MTIIKLKRAIKATWLTENPVLAAGEPGVELDTHMTKVGDGTTPWNDLPYDVGDPGAVETVDTLTTLTPSEPVHQYNITDQASALTIANPNILDFLDGRSLMIRIKDDGAPRAISWGDKYRGIGITLPSTTVAGKMLYVGAKWNAADGKFDVLSVGRQT